MPSAVPISAQSNVHREENQPRSFRSIGGFGGRSFTAQGLSFTGPGSFIVSPRFGSYTRAAALLGTSLGKSPLELVLFFIIVSFGVSVILINVISAVLK